MLDAGERRAWWRGRRVLVTGGAGFLGSNLVERLLELGARVRVADSRERAAAPRGWEGAVESPRADRRAPRACRDACAGQEVVFHFASRVGSSDYYRRHPGRVLTDNILLDAQLLAAAPQGR